MTNEDAIKWLVAIKEKYIHGGDEGFDEMRKEAIDTAIHSLNTQENLETKVTYLTKESRDREIKFKAVRARRQNGISDLNEAFEQGWQFVRASEFVPEYSNRQGYIEYILFKEFD